MVIWDILGIISGIALVVSFFIGKNAIWGALIAGAIIGVIVCLIVGFTWATFKNVLIVSILAGLFFEIFARLPKYLKDRKITRLAKRMVDDEMGRDYPDL